MRKMLILVAVLAALVAPPDEVAAQRIVEVRPALLDAGDPVLCIPGSGAVESLNMSCAAGIVLAEFWKQVGPRVF